MTRRLLLALAVAAVCAGCGSGAGLHIEDGGRTVKLHHVTTPTAPPSTGVTTPPQPGLHLGAPTALAYADGTLWCAVQPGSGVLVGSLVKVSAASGRPEGAAVPLPPAAQPYLLTVGADGVWLAAGTRLWKIDPATGAPGVHDAAGRERDGRPGCGRVGVGDRHHHAGRPAGAHRSRPRARSSRRRSSALRPVR